MADRQVQLRDEQGRLYTAQPTADGVSIDGTLVPAEAGPDAIVLLRGDPTRVAWAAAAKDECWVFLDGEVFTFEVERPEARRRRTATSHGSLAAPMPATVRQVAVAPGARVRQGDLLVVLEAMKMELPVRAPGDGTVVSVKCREGELVQAGQDLIEFKP